MRVARANEVSPMKRQVVALAVAMAAVVPLATGCAADEAEGREAAYPEPIGYTLPGSSAAAPTPASQSIQRPSPSTTDGEPEVVVGDPDESEPYADTDQSALDDFHPALDPYGTWADDPTYGTVWRPAPDAVGDDFTPYVSGGHWAYDDDVTAGAYDADDSGYGGYTWVSDYGWGWAPFHYGRWVYAGAGWAWVPGRAYAGAWVSWRYGTGEWGYVGWAPLAPTWGWHRGVAEGLGFVPRAPYAFVGSRDLFTPALGAHMVVGARVSAVAAHTTAYVPSSGRAGEAVGGPSPATLNIPASAVVHAPRADSALARARAFAQPRTAVALGARGSIRGAQQMWASRAAGSSRPSIPAYAPQESHFGGRLGRGFVGSGYAPARGASPRPPSPYAGSFRQTGSGYAPPSYGQGPSNYVAPPSYRAPVAAPRAGSYAGPSNGGGSQAAPAGGARGGGGGFHGGGGGSRGGGGGGGHGGGHR